MPVHKYRDVSEMPRPERVVGEALPARIRRAWRLALDLAASSPPRGVQRFTSIEAANEARDAATLARMRATAKR